MAGIDLFVSEKKSRHSVAWKERKMELRGKKAVFLGDSITEGCLATSPELAYHQILKGILGLREAVSYGIGGTRIARQKKPTEDPKYDLDFNMRADKMDKDADIVFVFGGTNDYGHGDAPLGAFGDDTVWTFYGALGCLYKTLIDIYGKDKIVILTPTHRINDTNRRGNGSKERESGTLAEYVEAIRKTAAKYSLKVIDLFAKSSLDPNDKTVNDKYFADGLHPNNAGHEKLAQVIAEEIEKII